MKCRVLIFLILRSESIKPTEYSANIWYTTTDGFSADSLVLENNS